MDKENGFKNDPDLEKRIDVLEKFVKHKESFSPVEGVIVWTLFACIAHALVWEISVWVFGAIAVMSALGVGAYKFTRKIEKRKARCIEPILAEDEWDEQYGDSMCPPGPWPGPTPDY